MSKQFLKDVEKGLNQVPKTLPSKYFYDKQGDELFMKIMHLPEYYLTRAELEIFKTKAHQLIDALSLSRDKYFELIELGAGDGLKTCELLKVLVQSKCQFSYLPIDISANALNVIESKIQHDLPEVRVKPMHGDYFKILDSLKKTQHPKVILFLGSNIGNMEDEQAAKFLKELSGNLNAGDRLLLGVDLIKPQSVVLPAYNDAQGVTEAFNLNLLKRINSELDANFDLKSFEHAPEYSEDDGIARSFLKSKIKQKVSINGTGNLFEFGKGECILTEISRKYNDEIIEMLIEESSFQIDSKIVDKNEYFANYVFSIPFA